jgi:RES domain-containing protein
METLVHLGAGALPLNRYLVRIDIPDDVWAAAELLDISTAPAGWDALPAGRASIACGTVWLASKRSACLMVPSTITPEESNVLINPAHPDSAKITAQKVRKWLYDARLLAVK